MIDKTMVPSDFHEAGEQSSSSFLDRLRGAVQKAGGPSSVSRGAGVPLSTLNTYLNGQPPKWTSLVSIANFCGISLDWLATGVDAAPAPANAIAGVMGQAMRAQAQRIEKDAEAGAAARMIGQMVPDRDKRTQLFATINIELLASAMEAADNAIRQANPESTNWRARAQLSVVLYDEAQARLAETND
jgi:DNA-binding phage protein